MELMMDEDAFPALIAETYLLPGDTGPVSQAGHHDEEPEHGAFQHLIPRLALAAFRSFSHAA
jgi:hypothetical protein